MVPALWLLLKIIPRIFTYVIWMLSSSIFISLHNFINSKHYELLLSFKRSPSRVLFLVVELIFYFVYLAYRSCHGFIGSHLILLNTLLATLNIRHSVIYIFHPICHIMLGPWNTKIKGSSVRIVCMKIRSGSRSINCFALLYK